MGLRSVHGCGPAGVALPPQGATVSAASFLPWLRKMGLLAMWPGTKARTGADPDPGQRTTA